MTKVLLKVNNKVMATDGKLMTQEKQEGTLLKTLLDATKSAMYLFYKYQGESLDGLISYSDTENVTNFSYMCSECRNLKNIQVPNISKGTNLYALLSGCEKLISYQPRILNTNNNTNFGNMFNGCNSLLKIDVTYFNAFDKTVYNFIYNNYVLKALIIRSFGDTYAIGSIGSSYWLKATTHSTHNPNGEQGYVYVPRDMIEKLQSATNWSELQFRALEDYTDDGTTTGKFLDEKAGI